MDNENADYGKRIRNLREYQKLSRERLAELANISTQFLADIETGKKGMSAHTLKKICSALHVSSDSIIFGRENSSLSELEAMFASIPDEKKEAMQIIIQKMITMFN